MKKYINKGTLVAFSLIPFFYWIYKCIYADLWCDEVFSLQNFVFADFIAGPALNYPEPNNHILLNIFGQIISYLCGVNNINDAASNVLYLRFTQALISLIIAIYSYKIVTQKFNLNHGFFVLVILFTTIPFINFSLQWRGYNLSSMFLVMIIYYCLQYIDVCKTKYRYIIMVSSCFLFYTIPSNIYILASVLTAHILLGILKNKSRELVTAKRHFQIAIYIFIGMALAFCFYLPVIQKVISNEYSSKLAEDLFYSIKLFPKVVIHFLSNRLLLLVFVFFGLFYKYFKSIKLENIVYLFAVLVLPFIFSFFHQKHPFDRVFVPLGPVFAMLVFVLASQAITVTTQLKKQYILLTIISIHCYWVFWKEIKNTDNQFSLKTTNHHMGYESIDQYCHLSKIYKPSKTIKKLKERLVINNVYLYRQADLTAVKFYLDINKMKYKIIDSRNEFYNYLLDNDSLYFLTTYRRAVTRDMTTRKDIDVLVIDESYPFTTIMMAKKLKTDLQTTLAHP